MEKEPLLRMEKISKHFPGVQALDNVDFEVYPGEILGFVGENGAGKSTLVKIIAGVYSKDHGTILLRGQQVELHAPKDAQSLGISTIHQELALVPHLSVAENIFLNRTPILMKSIGMVDFGRMNREAKDILSELGVDIPVTRLIKRLPVAAQQMVEIAKAFAMNASLILMDEPTSALSSRETDVLFAVIRRLRDKGVSVVFISHRLEEIRQIVDRVIVMRDGHRGARCPSQRLLKRTSSA
jgi:ribose transport system ATP-binding protein